MTHESNLSQPRLRLQDFDFELPAGRIAMEPARPRDASQLLVVERATSSWTDSRFIDLANHLRAGDLLVVNDTRVVRARVLGRLERTGRSVEVLFADPIGERTRRAMVRPGRRIREGDCVIVGTYPDEIAVEIGAKTNDGLRNVTVQSPVTVDDLLERHGHVPLPPYIERNDRDRDRTDYQTVFARHDGAIAAPTAGLHFSDAVFAALRERGVETVALTLHVGIGTFAPVRTQDPRAHRLIAERFEISASAAERLNHAIAENRRVIAVGTTTTRALEYAWTRHGRILPGAGTTDLYILPGYRFKVISGLVTNFHLPRSTLLLLVSAFAGRELVMDAYRHAIGAGYRFYSYGDATLFL